MQATFKTIGIPGSSPNSSWTINAGDCGEPAFDLCSHTSHRFRTLPVEIDGKETEISFRAVAVRGDNKELVAQVPEVQIYQIYNTEDGQRTLLTHQPEGSKLQLLDGEGDPVKGGTTDLEVAEGAYDQLLRRTMEAVIAARGTRVLVNPSRTLADRPAKAALDT